MGMIWWWEKARRTCGWCVELRVEGCSIRNNYSCYNLSIRASGLLQIQAQMPLMHSLDTTPSERLDC